jgi:hypothetical protein
MRAPPVTPASSALAIAAALLLAQLPSGAALAQPAEACGAERWRGFVGRTVGAMQRRLPPGPRARYVCRGCPMTMDFRPDRLTITFDRESRRVLALRCV